MTAPHTVHRIDNDPEKASPFWPSAYEVRDALGRPAEAGWRFWGRFGFNEGRDGPVVQRRASEAAEEARQQADWYAELPVGLRAGGFLETARTVRSRALDTLNRVHRDDLGLPREDKYTAEEREIIHDLEVAAGILNKWQRTGKTPKYPGK